MLKMGLQVVFDMLVTVFFEVIQRPKMCYRKLCLFDSRFNNSRGTKTSNMVIFDRTTQSTTQNVKEG